MELIIGLIVLLVLAIIAVPVVLFVVLPVVLIRKVGEKERLLRKAKKKMIPDDLELLEQGSVDLATKLEFDAKNTPNSRRSYNLSLDDPNGYLPILKQIGKVKGSLFKGRDFEYNLLGRQGRLLWDQPSRLTLDWVKKVIKIFQRLRTLMEKVKERPANLFESPLWPEFGYSCLKLFYTEEKRQAINDQELTAAFQGQSKSYTLPVAMLLRPEQSFWLAKEAWTYFPELPAELLPQALDTYGVDNLHKEIGLLWERIAHFPAGSEKQAIVLQWLRDHPELIILEHLLNPDYFTHSKTIKLALNLAALFPESKTLDFLRSLKKDQRIDPLIAKLYEQVTQASGKISFLEEPEVPGAISGTEDDPSGEILIADHAIEREEA